MPNLRLAKKDNDRLSSLLLAGAVETLDRAGEDGHNLGSAIKLFPGKFKGTDIVIIGVDPSGVRRHSGDDGEVAVYPVAILVTEEIEDLIELPEKARREINPDFHGGPMR